MKKSIMILAAAALMLASCADSFLDRQYEGASMSQEEFDKLGTSKLGGTMLGLYTMIYTNGSSSHDVFGQRSIDLWGDICCGDIAVTNKTYGWLFTDENVHTYQRTAYIWGFYYDIIRNANSILGSIDASSELSAKVDKYGMPGVVDTAAKYFTAEDTVYALYMAQALTMRGYCYANIFRFYTPVQEYDYMGGLGYDITTYECAPIYRPENMAKPQPKSTSEKVFEQAHNDFKLAVAYFDNFGGYRRTSKLHVNAIVARALDAYLLINAAPYYSLLKDEAMKAKAEKYYREAAKTAKEVLNNDEGYKMITRDQLFETGFNNIADNSWLWGQQVVLENRGALKSWFGQVDIHSYSYAWAGDTKVIDANLKGEFRIWDARAYWFNSGDKNPAYRDCPDGKFYSKKNRYSTATDSIDRDWLSDNVFLRYESMILTAAEAYYFLERETKLDSAIYYLDMLMSERIEEGEEGSYAEDKAKLTSVEEFHKMLIYNWRIEMWGEGYGFQTFRRLTKTTKRGSNHIAMANAEVKHSMPYFNFEIPTSETTYNPEISGKKLTE